MPPKMKQHMPLPPPVNTAAEGFEARVKDATPMVDLAVAFTPVLPLRTGSHPAANVPVKVKQDEDGCYCLNAIAKALNIKRPTLRRRLRDHGAWPID